MPRKRAWCRATRGLIHNQRSAAAIPEPDSTRRQADRTGGHGRYDWPTAATQHWPTEAAIIEHVSEALQGSLLDLTDEPGFRSLARCQRTQLAHGAWVDLLPGWLSGADALFGRLRMVVPWRAEHRRMYERVVAVPRLLCFYGEDAELPDPLLDQARDALDEHYAEELGEPFVTAGLCLYRDERDSVAWHGDTLGRGSYLDTMVAILSLGAPRPLLLRPTPGGGRTLRFDVGHGDLLVMGGSCQRTWQHAIPKSARPAGPRISVQFRPRGVR
jgi:alkylated DNA repair dioxygenase AlkB